MGISGLLPFLEKASRRCHVAEFRGCTVAIDSYCWLHKGAFGCAEKLVRGEDTNSYVLYCLKYLKMLQSYDIHPILVFDGQHLPAKQQTEEKRREQRKNSRKKATELLRIGKVEEARTHMRLCIDITHEMALALIKECRKKGIDCIVAPYEADAQMAYLNIKKFAHFVITEDSDLLLFGCNKILYKMDIQGFGTLVEADKINNCMKLRPDDYHFDKFRYMCILSGCDYLESLPGIGLKKALKFISMTADPSIYNVLLKLPSYLKLNNLIVTTEYRDSFMIADATFQHQLVFDPVKRKLLPLNDPKTYGTKEEYCKNAGNLFDNNLAFQIAIGNLDPFTHEKYDNWCPDMVPLPTSSIWSKQYQKPSVAVKKALKLTAPNLKNVEVDVQAIEQQKIEYDLKLKKELEIYNVVDYIEKKQELVEYEASKFAISKPINVPFLNMKKISKFERTLVDYDEGLTSRFFSSKSSSVAAEPSTSNYDSLLSGISDYTKTHRSSEFEDTVTGISQPKDLDPIKPKKHLNRFAGFDISKKVILIRCTTQEKIVPNNTDSTTESVKSQEIENNVNITNLQAEEKYDDIIDTKTDCKEIAVDENGGKCTFDELENRIQCNKRKPSGIYEEFGILKKKCLQNNISNKKDEQNESVIIDMDALEDSVDHQINIDTTDSLETESNIHEDVDSQVTIDSESRSSSPVLASSQSYGFRVQLFKRKMALKNQMNLHTMFENMKKK